MSNRDPHRIQYRLEEQIHLLLLEMEEKPDLFAFKDRLSMVQIVGMYLTRQVKLGDNERDEASGSTVRKYAGAFKTNVARRGKGSSGPTVYQLTADEPDTAAD